MRSLGLNSLKEFLFLTNSDAAIVDQLQGESMQRSEQASTNVYRVTFSFGMLTFMDYNPVLGYAFIQRPVDFFDLIRLAVHEIILQKNLLLVAPRPSQILAVPRLLNLPTISTFCVQDIQQFASDLKDQHFLQMIGIVVEISGTGRYTQSAQYFCADQHCAAYGENQQICLPLQGDTKYEVVGRQFYCRNCRAVLVEDSKCRRLSSVVKAKVIDFRASMSQHRNGYMDFEDNCNQPQLKCDERTFKRHQSVVVYVRDELVSGLQLGHSYHFIGIPLHKQGAQNDVFRWLEVNNYWPWDQETSDQQPNIPLAFQQLFSDRKESPWSFAFR